MLLLRDLRASLLPQKVEFRNPLHFRDMLEAIMAGYGCTLAQSAGIFEAAKSQGLIKELQGFRFQITPPTP